MEQPVDETVQDEAATPARKSTTRRSSTASTTRKKSTTPAAKTATKAAASKRKAEPSPEEETPAEKPKRTTTRRRSVKSKTETAADAAPTEKATADEPAAKPVRRTRRKMAQSTTATQTDAAENTAEETTDSLKPATTRKATTRKAASTKKATTSRGRKTTKTEPAPSVEPDETEAAEAVKPTKTTRTRRKKAEAPAAPAKKPRKPAKAKTTPAEAEAAESAEPADAPARPTRRRTTRKDAVPIENAEEVQAEAAPAEEEAPAKPARRRSPPSRTAAKQAAPAVETAEEAENAPTPETSVEGETETEDAAPRFSDLALSAPILKAVDEMGYTHPTPIQAQAIPEILAGHDVLGVAQTGTGKTASFTLPLLEKLSKSRARARMPRSLILEPTRELALQVAENFEKYGAHLRLNHALLIGGGKMNEQRDLLNRGVDVLIATPGRLLDMFERGGLLMTQTDLLVIDEADRMLDMGFIPDIERIVSLLPRRRQTLFFSATMAPEIRRLADNFLTHPKEITVARQSSVASTITEGLLVVEKNNKNRALSALLRQGDVQNAIVFCNRKRDVDMLQSYLTRQKFAVGHLHGDLTQTLRFETLERFRAGELQILVCSDVAARGIDIGGLSHVFNYDLPFNAEDYVHRIGRTGRAGKEGKAYSLATPDEHKLLDAVETLTGKTIEPVEIKGFRSLDWREEDEDNASPAKGRGRGRGGKPSSKADEVREAEEPTKQERAPRKKQVERNPMPEARKHDHRRGRAELLPPVPEKNGIQDGFGENVPAFMKVSFVPEPRDPSES